MKNVIEFAPIVILFSLLLALPLYVAKTCGEQDTQKSVFNYVFWNTKENALRF